MTVASFIAAQRTEHGVPHAVSCRALEVPVSTFYKWRDRPLTARQRRRAELDAAVKASFEDSGGNPGTYGSPRVWEDLVEAGWRVSKKTVAASMARQGLQGRCPKRKRRSLTRPDKAARPFPDLLGRDFTARRSTSAGAGTSPRSLPTRASCTWRRCWTWLRVGCRASRSTSTTARRSLALLCAWLLRCVAGTWPGWCSIRTRAVSTPDTSSLACGALGVTQSMGRVGSALDNAAAESFNSTLEHELLSRRRFATKAQARQEVARFIDAYNTRRRHSSAEMLPPVRYEQVLAVRAAEREIEAKAA